MKTKQEQTKEMAEKMKRCFEKNGLLNFKWFAEALVQAGYGDVSEYKAEIERLNSHNGFLQSAISHSKDMLDEAVKQAQIDVLNKVKKCSYCDNDFMDGKWHRYVFVSDIDELIEEIENDKCNC